MTNKGQLPVAGMLIGLVVVGLILGAYLLGQRNNSSLFTSLPTSNSNTVKSSSPTIVNNVNPSSKESTNEATGVSNQKRYTSYKLGVSFLYLTRQGEQEVGVKESGNKIFLYATTNPPEQGQYVEVFPKEESITLEEAVREQFLGGYSREDCFVKAIANPVAKQKTSESFKFVEISFPQTPESDGPWWQNGDKCPQPYTSSNGISYFIMDSNHPDKFAFLSIGQYAILADENNTVWQSTLKFL